MKPTRRAFLRALAALPVVGVVAKKLGARPFEHLRVCAIPAGTWRVTAFNPEANTTIAFSMRADHATDLALVCSEDHV